MPLDFGRLLTTRVTKRLASNVLFSDLTDLVSGALCVLQCPSEYHLVVVATLDSAVDKRKKKAKAETPTKVDEVS